MNIPGLNKVSNLWNGFKIWNIFQGAMNKTKEANMTGKKWYESMTIWANALMAVLTVIQPDVTAFVAGHPGAAAVVAAISNLLLRLRTDKPVA